MQVCDSYAVRSRNALLLLFSYDFCRVLSSWISENILICAEINLCFRICPTTMQKVSDSSDEPEAQKKSRCLSASGSGGQLSQNGSDPEEFWR